MLNAETIISLIKMFLNCMFSMLFSLQAVASATPVTTVTTVRPSAQRVDTATNARVLAVALATGQPVTRSRVSAFVRLDSPDSLVNQVSLPSVTSFVFYASNTYYEECVFVCMFCDTLTGVVL